MRILFIIMTLVFLVPLSAQSGLFGNLAYEEDQTNRKKGIFNRTKKRTPPEQLTFANRLRAQGRIKKAGKQYRALLKRWPDSAEAPQAQLGCAEILEERNRFTKAFDEYQFLMDRYAGKFDYDKILRRQFIIASNLIKHKENTFILFRPFVAPEKTIPMFEQIVKNGPHWEEAPHAQYLVGYVHELVQDYESAIDAYRITQHKYPESTYAQEASFGQAYCLYYISEETPNDEKLMEQAWAAVNWFLRNHPMADHAEVAHEYRKSLYRRRAKASFKKAQFYDKILRKPRAALSSYENFLRQFPQSEWTSMAEIRIELLKKATEEKNEE